MQKSCTLLTRNLTLFCITASSLWATGPNFNIKPLNSYATSTNRTFKLDLDGECVVFRVGRDNPEHVGIDRNAEMELYALAESLGIAPKLVGYEIDNGLLMTRYIDGASPSEQEIRQQQVIEKVVRNLQLLHTHTAPDHKTAVSTVFSRNHALLETVKHTPFYPDIQQKIDRWQTMQRSFEADYYAGIPRAACHGDLFRGNILLDQTGKLFFIDWEYSFYGYVIDDIGKFCSSNWLGDTEIKLVSERYWGRSDEQLLKKLHQNIFMQQFNFFLWCHVQGSEKAHQAAAYYATADRVSKHLDVMSHTIRTEGIAYGKLP